MPNFFVKNFPLRQGIFNIDNTLLSGQGWWYTSNRVPGYVGYYAYSTRLCYRVRVHKFCTGYGYCAAVPGLCQDMKVYSTTVYPGPWYINILYSMRVGGRRSQATKPTYSYIAGGGSSRPGVRWHAPTLLFVLRWVRLVVRLETTLPQTHPFPAARPPFPPTSNAFLQMHGVLTYISNLYTMNDCGNQIDVFPSKDGNRLREREY